MIHHKKLLAVLVSLACTAAAAQSNINPIMGKPNTCGAFKIAFINGIDTERDAAEENLKRITTAYGNAHQEHLISYVLAYNQTRGFPTDFYQASLQALSTFVGATWADYYNAVQSAIYTLKMPKTLAATIAKRVDDWYALTKPSQYSDQDLADILSDLKYATQWSPGVRMVIVSHSQGNEYATLVVPKLIASGVPASSIGAVGVAVPDFSVPTGNTYVTSSNDFVTDATRLVLAILPANVTIPYNSLDLMGHNFVKVYMANSTARGMIVTGIKNEFASLKTPTKPSLSFDNTFSGTSSWANCTHEPYPSGPPWTPPPPTKREPLCGAPPAWHWRRVIGKHTRRAMALLCPAVPATVALACMVMAILSKRGAIGI
jgi:hypothetical protein